MSTSKKKWNTIVSLQLPSLCDRSALPTLILFKWLTSEWLVCFFGWAPNHNKKSSFVARSWFMLLRLGCFRFLGNKHPHFLVDGWICCVLCLFSSLFVYRGETSQALLFFHQSWNYVNYGGLLSFLFVYHDHDLGYCKSQGLGCVFFRLEKRWFSVETCVFFKSKWWKKGPLYGNFLQESRPPAVKHYPPAAQQTSA